LVVAFVASGLTRTEFARREGVKYTTLCNWVQRGGTVGERAKVPSVVRFAEMTLPSGPACRLEVRLQDGTTAYAGTRAIPTTQCAQAHRFHLPCQACQSRCSSNLERKL
jgi:hypothetical protein